MDYRVRTISRPSVINIYSHGGCLDGDISAAMTSNFARRKLRIPTVVINPVGHGGQRPWADEPIDSSDDSSSAVVDVPYHEGADRWADHHPEAFATPALQADFERKQRLDPQLYTWKPKALSCSSLLLEHYYQYFDYREDHFAELAEVADKIDTSDFDSPEDAIYGDHPAAILGASTLYGNSNAFHLALIEAFATTRLAKIIERGDVRDFYGRYKDVREEHLEKVNQNLDVKPNGITILKATGLPDSLIPLFGPYIYAPETLYLVVIIGSDTTTKVRITKNPWIHSDRQPIALDQIAARFGGGGHNNRGTVTLRDANPQQAQNILNGMIRELHG